MLHIRSLNTKDMRSCNCYIPTGQISQKLRNMKWANSHRFGLQNCHSPHICYSSPSWNRFQLPLQIFWFATHLKNIPSVAPDMNIVTMSVKPLVRIAVHDVEGASRCSSGYLCSVEDKPLQLLVRTIIRIKPKCVTPKLNIAVGPILRAKVCLPPIVDKVEPVNGMPFHVFKMPNSMRACIVPQVHVGPIRAHIFFVELVVQVIRFRITIFQYLRHVARLAIDTPP